MIILRKEFSRKLRFFCLNLSLTGGDTMTRKRLTQIFPWILPVRQKQRKIFFYLHMALDKNTYARKQSLRLLPEKIFRDSALMLNEGSGYDLQYQYNKIHNLKLAAAKVHGLLIKPGETFSLCLAIKDADKETPYRDGLSLVDGEIRGEYGGGLCQLSNLLYWLFLHTPLTVTERHGHETESIPPVNPDEPAGIDATIAEGWLDLKVRNNTPHTYQLSVTFDGNYIEGAVLCDSRKCGDYRIYNTFCEYVRRNGIIYQEAEVTREWVSCFSEKRTVKLLYKNSCVIDYPLPKNVPIRESGNSDAGEKSADEQAESFSGADSSAMKEGF